MKIANQNEILELAAQGAFFYIGHSAGKDSMAMYEAIIRLVPSDQVVVVHADLGDVEHVDVKDFIRNNIDGRELLVAHAIHADGSPKDFFSAVRARRVALDTPTAKYPNARREAPAFPSGPNRFCTSDLKRDPIWKVIKRHASKNNVEIVINCVGIRAQESDARALKIEEKGTLNINEKNTVNKRVQRQAFDWWPIAHWSIDEVWAEIAAAGKTPHPAYAAGNERLSCAFCIFGSVNDLRNAAAERPELLAAFAELEIEVRTTMFATETLAERIA